MSNWRAVSEIHISLDRRYIIWKSIVVVVVVVLVTSDQSNVAKRRIADLSSLVAANGFVRSWPHLMHGSLEPRESDPLPPNGISIGSAVLVQLTGMPCKQTDRQTHTDNATCDICSNRRCGLIISIICYLYMIQLVPVQSNLRNALHACEIKFYYHYWTSPVVIH